MPHIEGIEVSEQELHGYKVTTAHMLAFAVQGKVFCYLRAKSKSCSMQLSFGWTAGPRCVEPKKTVHRSDKRIVLLDIDGCNNRLDSQESG